MQNKLYDIIKKYKKIVVARHIGVDPDAMCSQLAIREMIKITFPSKEVYAVGSGTNKFKLIGELDKEPSDFKDALLIVTDTPDSKRVDISSLDEFSYIIKIDHHPFIEKFANLEIIDDKKSSACEIIMELLENSKFKCNKEIAEYLYMGLVSDSNRFLFNSCTYKTFYIAARYIKKYKLDIESLYSRLYLRPISEVRLKGYIEDNLTITPNNLAYIKITDELLKKYNCDSASPGNMINDLNYIENVLVWATITEDIKNNVIRISIRSRGPVINEVAQKHGGGGHKMASGVKVKSFDLALDVMKDLDELLKEYNKKNKSVVE